MLERLIEHVTQLPAEELRFVTIQDMAICAAWFDSYSAMPAEQRRYAAVTTAREEWLLRVSGLGRATEGRRCQWVLRELIDQVQGGQLGQLKWDEVDMLHHVADLAASAREEGLFTRVRELLEPYKAAVTARRDALRPAPGLPRLSERLRVITSRDIRRARPREIKLFAGIDMPSRGPVMVLSGHIRVLDNVPENCTLVVEDGSCSVDGFVMGKVAATENCEVRENISGVVVVRQGDVRTRNIIDKAYVVAKWGRVHCRHAQSPELVFAGTEICIEDEAVMGRYIAPRIRVNGAVYGGELHASSHVHAGRFRCSDARGLSIVLRRELSCRDYGETPDEEASRLLAKAVRIRRSLDELNDMIQWAEREAEHCAGSGVLFLAQGEVDRAFADRVQKAENRIAALDRITRGLHSLGLAAEEQLLSHTAEAADSGRDAGAADGDFEAELRALSSADSVDRDLQEELAELAEMRAKWVAARSDRRATLALLMRVREREAERTQERQELIEAVERWLGEIGAGVTLPNGDEKGGGPRSKIRGLQRALAALRDRPPDDPLSKRVRSGFMRVTLRTLNSRLERSKIYRARAAELREELTGVCEPLRRDYHIIIEEQGESQSSPARATGLFEDGVRIYSDPFLLGEENPPPGTVVRTSGLSESVGTFVRGLNSVRREA
ncbi:MAG: hypothetical protein JXR94_01255 [Candidatus Hydrogenedentes bacterium]|nr:hypothetical protein [Candidatus Hydrogenedentota bacterium]